MPKSSRPANILRSGAVAGLVIAAPGMIGLLYGHLLLFPSLGPTAVMQAHSPNDRSARPYSVIVSHMGGMASAYFWVLLLGIGSAPSIFDAHTLTAARVVAAIGAIVLAVIIELALRASHPPAASTTLLVALGSFKAQWSDVLVLIAGILTVAAVGEAARRYQLRMEPQN